MKVKTPKPQNLLSVDSKTTTYLFIKSVSEKLAITFRCAL